VPTYKKSMQFAGAVYLTADRSHVMLQNAPSKEVVEEYLFGRVHLTYCFFDSRKWREDKMTVIPQRLRMMVDFAESNGIAIHPAWRTLLDGNPKDAEEQRLTSVMVGPVPAQLDFRA